MGTFIIAGTYTFVPLRQLAPTLKTSARCFLNARPGEKWKKEEF